MLFFLTLSLSPPGKENEKRVTAAASEVIFGNGNALGEQNRVEVKQRGWGLSMVLFAIYLLAFILIFGAVSYALNSIGFTPLGIGLFLFYTSIVTYFGIRVRESSKELVMVGGKETVSSIIFDFSALPFLRVGRKISSELARFNVLGLLATLLVEAPFQMVLEVLEEWIHFAREKKEGIGCGGRIFRMPHVCHLLLFYRRTSCSSGGKKMD